MPQTSVESQIQEATTSVAPNLKGTSTVQQQSTLRAKKPKELAAEIEAEFDSTLTQLGLDVDDPANGDELIRIARDTARKLGASKPLTTYVR